MWPFDARKRAIEQLVETSRALLAESAQFIVYCREISALVATVDPDYTDETLCFFVRLDAESIGLPPAEVAAEVNDSRRADLIARQAEFLSRYCAEGLEAATDVIERYARAA